MQHADTFKHPMRTGDNVTVVDMRHLGRTKRQLIVDKGASSHPAVAHHAVTRHQVLCCKSAQAILFIT